MSPAYMYVLLQNSHGMETWSSWHLYMHISINSVYICILTKTWPCMHINNYCQHYIQDTPTFIHVWNGWTFKQNDWNCFTLKQNGYNVLNGNCPFDTTVCSTVINLPVSMHAKMKKYIYYTCTTAIDTHENTVVMAMHLFHSGLFKESMKPTSSHWIQIWKDSYKDGCTSWLSMMGRIAKHHG